MCALANSEPVKLSLLIARHFLADCCAGRSARYTWSFGAAVRLWAADLGREPTTADLTADGIAQFLRHLRHAGHGVERLREHRTRLHTLWSYAHRRGLASSPATVKVVAEPAVSIQLPSGEHNGKPLQISNLFDSPAPADTVRNYYQVVYAPEELADKVRKSIQGHETALRSLWHHYNRDLALEEQTNALAAAHFGWMVERGQSNWAINNVRECWFAQWRHAVARGRVDRLPLIRPYKVERTPPDALTIKDMKRLLAAADDWWRALLLVGYWTLQRRRALLEIPAAAVDLDGGWINFPPSSNKRSNGIRCRIGADAIAALRAVWPPAGPYVFSYPPNRLCKDFRELLARAGVRPSLRKNGQFHLLRRTGATHAVIRGGMAVVCDLLGQSSIYVTKLYIDKTQLPGHDVTRLLPLLMDDVTNQRGPENDNGH